MSEENDALAQRSWELAIQHNPDALGGLRHEHSLARTRSRRPGRRGSQPVLFHAPLRIPRSFRHR